MALGPFSAFSSLSCSDLALHTRSCSGMDELYCIICVYFLLVNALSSQLEGFQSVSMSSITLLRSLLGDFDLVELERAAPVMGPLVLS